MALKFSYLLSFGLAAGIGMWMYTGTIVKGGQGDTAGATPPPSERTSAANANLFRVQVVNLKAQDREAVLEVRGRTQANARVQVRSETAARVISRPAQEGAKISKGDALCELDKGTRRAGLLEAKANLDQAQLDFNAAQKLSSKGFTAQNQLAASQAALDAAKARLEEAELELDHTLVRAPIDGIIESPMAEVGARLNTGDVCATVVNTDPMKAIGQVSELNVGDITPGMPAKVDLVTGQSFDGTVRYVAPAADSDTRTFRIEVEIPNADGAARDGITALTRIPLRTTRAHKISPAILTLNDEGQVGLRTVNADNVTEFHPVKVLGGAEDGVWVSGLPETVTAIIVGQDYVADGQKVEPVMKTAEAFQ
ncbi:efflux RND transporter periplasmic adaptor subunit [Roseibium litorale]|uniref:Efflux RND transporter periplasmic adaptor subunit n=1 Tax=Roseibium litorale TaxID=2803841 RepID=A0ABR9CQ54_9HYPH|nr:efflux RND transporter periplasmic adaptor subunit [Roseibium litorale]MBD8892784.1 efflux RND transporter periplasmic adaptor subunit [Roseibium litorale]